MERWQDHYSVLQVHPDAEIEVIQSAYKRLAKKYHPDVNPSPAASEKFKRINEAYEVLSNAASRRSFHSEWVRRSGARITTTAAPRVEVKERVVYVNRPAPAPPPPPPPPKKDNGTPEAVDALKNYFNYLAVKNFRAAFEVVSEADKQKFDFRAFEEWQKSVTAIYQVAKFRIDLFKRQEQMKIGEGKFCRAEELKISVAERDLRSGRINEYSFTKFVINEDGNWRVYLGYKDLTPLLVQFKTMATTQEETLLRGQWDDYRDTHDLKLGLPNRKGFERFVQPEIYRFERYERPFSVAVFEISLPERALTMGNHDHVVKYVGYLINDTMRMIDKVAWLGNDCFGVSLAETDRKNALLAARRILKTIKHDVAACFDFGIDIKIGVTPYAKGLSVDDMIDGCMRTIAAVGAK